MRSRAALEDEWAAVRSWVVDLLDAPDATSLLEQPSALDGWTVRELVAHLALALSALTAAEPAPRGVRPLAPGDYMSTYPDGAQGIADRTRAVAAEAGEALLELLDDAWDAAVRRLDELGDDERRVVAARRGPVRLGDLVTTRLVELVVHGDDLARSTPSRPGPQHDVAALRAVVRVLLDALVARAPGRTVEVRVPPYAAVQCVAGTSHTRGTPPNVVETDALTWVRLACGRTTWPDARDAGALTASGTRADEVSAALPLL